MIPIQLREDLLKEPAPPLLRDDGSPPFRDLAEAEAFAMGNLLIKSGMVSCKEWETAMNQAILRAQEAGDPDRGDTYFNHWADALENVVIAHQLTDRETLSAQQALWDRAIRNTPHGVALSLENAFLEPHDHGHHHHDHDHEHDHEHGHHDHDHDHDHDHEHHHHDHEHDHGHGHHHHGHGHDHGAKDPEEVKRLTTPVAVLGEDGPVVDEVE
jgi:nitrile hydratase accessory protein